MPNPWFQTEILTVLLDEEIKQFKSFVKDRFHYRLAINEKYFYLDCRYLNASHSPSDVQLNDVIDMYELEDLSHDRQIKIIHQQEKQTRLLRYWMTGKNGAVNSFELANMDEVDRIQVKFAEDRAGVGVLVYYDQHNDGTNKTIWMIHFGDDGHFYRGKYVWKTTGFGLVSFPVRITPQSSSEFYFLYYDTFNKTRYSEDQRFVNFNVNSMTIPYLGLYSLDISRRSSIKKYVQVPIFCASDYVGQWNLKLSTFLTDAYHERTERGTSYFFLIENRLDQSQAVCLMNSRDLEKATTFKDADKFYCDWEGNYEKCTSKELPLNDVVLRFEKSAYERMLVKSFYSKETQTETSIIFLVEKGSRQQLLIYNLIMALRKDGSYHSKQICFEGIYKLRSQKEVILDIQLENKTNSILIITRNYIQRIPIGSFCTANSFSSCQSVSTCTLANSTCQNPERRKGGCIAPSELKSSKMNSEEYMCDRETRDVCLVGHVKPETKANYQGKLCDADSCRCQVSNSLVKKLQLS